MAKNGRIYIAGPMPDAARAIVKDAGANVPLPMVIEAPSNGSTTPFAGSRSSAAA